MLETQNYKRKEKQYHVGQVVYENKYGDRNKLNPRYRKKIIKEVMRYKKES